MNTVKSKRVYVTAQYLTLFFVMSVAALFYQRTETNLRKFIIIFALGIFYVLWGYWHHTSNKRFDRVVFFEYLTVAILAILLSALGLGLIRFF